MSTSFPRSIDEVTPEWLSSTLGRRVTAYQTDQLEGSNLAVCYRLRDIEYAGGETGPASLIVKVAHPASPIREIAMAGGFYTREVRFFIDLSAKTPLATPQVFGCFSDERPACEYFIIVMEDLAVHSKVYDQVDDPPDEVAARRVATELAQLHASFWGSEVTRLSWLSRPDGRYLPPVHFLCDQVVSAWPVLRREWRNVYGDDFVGDHANALEPLAALLCGPKSRGIHRRIYDVLSSRPQTLLHGDARADNIFRTIAMKGDGTPERLTYIDFQLMHAGPPGPDFTEAWIHSLEPEVRRRDRDMLRHYHDIRVGLKPESAAYTYDMLLEDYALAACFWWTLIITFAVEALKECARPEGARQKRLWAQMARRHNTALCDLDCLARIRDLASGLPDD